MKRWLTLLFLSLLVFSWFAGARARRDPLNDKEVDELREVAQDPDKRLKLYVEYTQKRLVAVEELRSPTADSADRGAKIHDAIEDFNSLVQEISDNLDAYSQQKQDFRKALDRVIQAQADWQNRLQRFKDGVAQDPGLSKKSRDFYFALDGAIDDLRALGEDARETLAQQNQAKSKKK